MEARGRYSVKKDFFLLLLFLMGDILTSYLEGDRNDPLEEVSDTRWETVLGVMSLN